MSFAVLLAFTGSSQGKYVPRLPVSTEILIIVQNEESFHLNWQFSLHLAVNEPSATKYILQPCTTKKLLMILKRNGRKNSSQVVIF